jgi:thymidine kinase
MPSSFPSMPSSTTTMPSSFPSMGGLGGANPPYESAQVILINEGQFFPDIVEWVKHAVEIDHKTVYVCGLSSDYKRNKFGNWLDLETICDKVVMLYSFCGNCKKKPAIFSHRISKETDLEVIGGAECYIPVCRICYLKTI